MKSEYEDNSVKVYFELFVNMMIDYCFDCFYGKNIYIDGYDLIDINVFWYYEIDLLENYVENSFDVVKIDVDLFLNEDSSIKFGLLYK